MSTHAFNPDPNQKPNWVSTRNPCKACAPLGATVVMRGIEGSLPFLHGSQGCATYIRRYLISHFREPMDIATSGFSEATTVFGGAKNLFQGLDNVSSQYSPEVIGIATTCLTETIGEDMNLMLHEYHTRNSGKELPILVHTSTPSYCGTHVDGFHDTVFAVITQLAGVNAEVNEHAGQTVNIFPGMVSAEDLRFLKQVAEDFDISLMLFPDYSETLDGPSLKKYQEIPVGGTTVASLRTSSQSAASIEFGRTLRKRKTAASHLKSTFAVPAYRLGTPIGIRETDEFFAAMETVSGRPTPEKYTRQRGRLIDSYVDGHKYLFGKKAIIYGDEDFVVGMASFFAEVGIIPVLCASGGKSGMLETSIKEVTRGIKEPVIVRENIDFATMAEELEAESLQPDFMIGSSKGAKLARSLRVPLIRCNFPVHDRFGGPRFLHIGYQGTQQLFDLIVNTLLEVKQDSSPIGYSYL